MGLVFTCNATHGNTARHLPFCLFLSLSYRLVQYYDTVDRAVPSIDVKRQEVMR